MSNIDMNYVMEVKGQISQAEAERLQYLASLVPDNGIIVEIGAYAGRSTCALASGMKDTVHLYSIDPWMLLDTSLVRQGYHKAHTLLEYRSNIEPVKDKITQIVAWPYNVARIFNAPINLLFMDQEKQYDKLKPAWEAFIPHVKCGGWIASHDYDENPQGQYHFPELLRVFDEVVWPRVDMTTKHTIHLTVSGQIK